MTKSNLPIFPKVVALLALPASLFRLFIGITLVQALSGGANSGIPIALSWAEAATGLLAGLFGVFGSINLLKGMRSSIKQCWTSIAFNIANILVAFVGFQLFPMQLPFFDTVGLGLIRIFFTLIFVFAILHAASWFRSQSTQELKANTKDSFRV